MSKGPLLRGWKTCLALFGLTAACNTGDVADPRTARAGCPESLAPLRRLAQAEYASSVRDLVGQPPSAHLPPDEAAHGLAHAAESLAVSPLLAERFLDAAEEAAARAVTDLPRLLGCSGSEVHDACVRRFVASFGRRAWRRPLQDAEVGRMLDLVASEPDEASGISLALASMLASPHFLYHVETTAAYGDVVLDDYAIAARLSYLLWGTTPDDALLDAAASGAFATPNSIEARARMMIADPRAQAGFGDLVDGWLGLDDLPNIARSAADYPMFTPALREAMATETHRFVAYAILEADGSLETLFTAPTTFADAQVAALYGTSVAGAGFQRIALDPAQRSGVLTQPSLLAVYSKSNQSSPIHRGKFVRERLLCQTLPDPPPGIAILPPQPAPGSSTRQRFAQHDSDPKCAGCHRRMDPIGFGFESFDPLGRFRKTDNGFPVDATGLLEETDVDGPFTDVRGLAAKLVASKQVRACVATQWFRLALGRFESDADKASLDAAKQTFGERNNLRELAIGIAKSDAFTCRNGAP